MAHQICKPAGRLHHAFDRLAQCFEELGRLKPQGRDDFRYVDEGNVALSTLNAAHVASVNFTRMGESLLRKTLVLVVLRTAAPNAKRMGFRSSGGGGLQAMSQ